MTMFRSSLIQTLLSVLEFHQFNPKGFADCTAGRELHPALKILCSLVYKIAPLGVLVKNYNICYDGLGIKDWRLGAMLCVNPSSFIPHP